jgi:uncharacterized protein (TIGR02145 family)
MKKLITLLALVATIATFAQAPQGFNYQATVRNSSGALIVNQIVLVKFKVLQNSVTGTIVYSENQTANTDDLGHIALVVGQGTAITGTFSSINWGSGSYYLGIELNTGSGYVDMGTTQLLSVPYALYSNSSASSTPQNLTSVLNAGNSANNTKIINLGDPVNPKDAVNKEYVDAQIQALQNYINALPVTDIDGNTYLPVAICNQTWTKSNLNVSRYRNGDVIPQVTDPNTWANLTTGAWCYYNNDPANGPIYGKLYNWYAVNDPRGLAPQGWHVPTDTDWTTLTNCLGGTSIAGGKMKEVGITHWNSPNTNATNLSGFTGLPGGNRGNDGNYYFLNGYGNWWSSTLNITNRPWSRALAYNNSIVGINDLDSKYGFSVRCVKDSPQVGDNYQGGIIIHINQPGDLGYVPGQIHGIIASTVDQTINSTSQNYPGQTGCMWQPGTYIPSQQTTSFNITNSVGVVLGTGGLNTSLILAVSQQVGLPFPAATLASQYNGGGFNDWKLPSKDELGLLYQYRTIVGGFANGWYWSSTEKNEFYVDALDFSTGNFSQIGGYKGPGATPYKVRAIRYF